MSCSRLTKAGGYPGRGLIPCLEKPFASKYLLDYIMTQHNDGADTLWRTIVLRKQRTGAGAGRIGDPAAAHLWKAEG